MFKIGFKLEREQRMRIRRYVYTALMFVVLSISSYAGLSYLNSHEYIAHAQSGENDKSERDIIKIPPPIEGTLESVPARYIT